MYLIQIAHFLQLNGTVLAVRGLWSLRGWVRREWGASGLSSFPFGWRLHLWDLLLRVWPI